ncbi:MAG: LysR substrate-binding domain-containing protein [Gammaproteobacteria bacterium]|nr:LysR substrate-binding domain-containing protein [Gammaproteobacteria bacterium]
MKITNRQLSLRGLRTFCVAASHKSFRLAAEELFVTPSAVSHQIKSLEDELGVTLFTRSANGLDLTATGQALFDQTASLIRQLDEATAPFRSRTNRTTLRISVQPFFASEIFVSRLAEFTALHPEIDIHIDTSDESPEKHPASADLSIRLFRSAPAHLESDVLFPLRVVPACSPQLRKEIVGSGRKPKKPYPVVVHANRVVDWQTWSEGSGIEIPEPSNIVHLNSMFAVVRAAEQGLGVALVPMPLSEGRFKSGRLVRLYKDEIATPDCYHLVYAEDSRNRESVQALRQWVLETIAPAT